MILYLSGPMTGISEHNFPAFHAGATQLRDAGFTVLNPAEAGSGEMSWADYLRRDLRQVLDSDGIALLSGWSLSRGAKLEVHVAEELGMASMTVEAWIASAARGRK